MSAEKRRILSLRFNQTDGEMYLALGAVLIVAAFAIVWKYSSPEGTPAHPFTERPFLGMALPIVVLCLAVGGVASIVSWYLG